MKTLETQIQEKLSRKKKHQRYIAVLLALSMLVAFVIPYEMILPAVSMTEEAVPEEAHTLGLYTPPEISVLSFDDNDDDAIANGNGTNTLTGAGYFGNPQTTALGVNLANNNRLTSIEVSLKEGNNYTECTGTPILVSAGNSDPAELRIDLKYAFSSTDMLKVLNDPNHCVYFDIAKSASPGDVLKIKQDYYGDNQKVTDAQYSSTKPSGYFSVASNGMLVIHFTDDYINYLRKNQNGFSGTVNFKAQVDKGDSADGDRDFTLAGTEIKVDFAKDKFTIEKQGVIGKNTDGTNYIDWTVTIKNPKGHINLQDYTLTDILKVAGTEDNPDFSTISPTVTAKDRNGNDMTVTATGSGNTLTFSYTAVDGNADTGNPAEVKITYRQVGVVNGEINDNTASLSGGDSECLPENPGHDVKTVDNSFELSKTGTPDYQISGEANDTVQWTVTVANKSGDSLSKAIVTDGNDFPISNTKVYDLDGNDITEKCTISGKTLTFNDDSTIPSKVTIVYTQENVFAEGVAYESGVNDGIPYAKLKNTVSVEMPEGTENPPAKENKDGYTEYKRQLKTEKTGQYNPEESTIQWKIKVYANKAEWWGVDTNSTANLNGYTIQDAEFANFTLQEDGSLSDADGNKITFNIQHNYSSAAGTASLSKTNDNTVKIACSDDVNYIELFYTRALTETEKENLNNAADGKITVTNTATANRGDGYTSGYTGTVECAARYESEKTYTGDETNAVTIGTIYDNRPRTLSWQIVMNKDTGFGDNGLVVTDILQASGQDGANLHYIKPSQASAVKLYAKCYDAVDYPTEALDSDLYTVIFKDANGNVISNFASQTDDAEGTVNAVSFKVQFKDNANKILETYRYVKLVYETTANVSAVEEGQTVAFQNTSTFGTETPHTVTAITFERKKASQPDTSKLTVHKVWDDTQNAYGFRPDSIQVKVLRALANDDGTDKAENAAWEYIKDENNEVKIYTLSMNASGSDCSAVISDDFDQWQLNQDGSVTHYVYKIEELDVSNYEIVENNDIAYLYGKTNETLSIKNELRASNVYGKSAVDQNGNALSEINYSNLQKAKLTIDGTETEVFLIRWKISFDLDYDESTKNEYVDFIDTLPKGAVYISQDKLQAWYSTYWGEMNVTPYISYTGSDWSNLPENSVTVNNNQLTMHFQKQTKWFMYYIGIPVSDFSDSLKNDVLINKIKLNQSGEVNHEGRLQVDNVPEVNLLDKAGISSTSPGFLNYSLDINPKGAQLSNDGFIDITDTLTLQSGDGSNLRYSLQKVEVYPYEGNQVSSTPLPSSDYTVFPECNVTENVPVSYSFTKGNTNYSTTDMQAGDQVTITLKGEANHTFTNLNIYTNNWDNKKTNPGFVDLSGRSLDANGLLTYNYTVEEGTETLYIDAWDADTGKITSVITSITNRTTSAFVPARLTLTLPDRQHLHVEYTYTVTGWTQNQSVTFSNMASMETDYASAKDIVDNYALSTQDAEATSQAMTFPELYKVDIGNYALNSLSATFKVAKYENGEWIYANAVTLNSETLNNITYSSRYFDFTSNLKETNDKYPTGAANLVLAPEDNVSTPDDKENEHKFSLEAGTLYKFVEVTAPVGYNQPDWSNNKTLTDNKQFVFYYLYKEYNTEKGGTFPQNITYHTVLENGKVEIPNTKTISVSVNKTFSGTNLPTTDTPSTVTFKLYRSVSKSGVQSEVSGSEKSITYPTATTVSWTNLVSGEDGKPYYYFVREISYTDNGKTYAYDETDQKYYLKNTDSTLDKTQEGRFKPVYSGNGINTTDTVSVNNSEGIIIQKLWKDKIGRTISPPNGVNSSSGMEIAFQITGIDRNGERTVLQLPEDAVLKPDNNYLYVVPASLTDGYMRFEAEELLTSTQTTLLEMRNFSEEPQIEYSVSNGAGLITITNQDMTPFVTSASVQKIWGDNASHSESIQVRLIQTTEEKTSAQLKAMNSASSSVIAGSNSIMVIAPGASSSYTLNSSKTYSSHTLNSETSAVTAVKATDSSTISITAGSTEEAVTLTVSYTDGSTEEIIISVISQTAALTSGNLTKVWNNLPYADSSGNRYYYYVLESSSFTGYTASYAAETSEEEQKTIITNNQNTSLNVTKQWAGMDSLSAKEKASYQKNVTVRLECKLGDSGTWAVDSSASPITLSSENSWSASFSNLPKTDANGTVYYYRVVETHINGSTTGLNAFSITSSSESISFGADDTTKAVTITNTLKTGALEAEKIWKNDNPDDRQSVTVNVYREKLYPTSGKARALIYSSMLNQEDTLAGINQNVSRVLSPHQLDREEETQKPALTLKHVNFVLSYSNDQVTADGTNFNMQITDFDYNSSNNTISFTIPQATMQAIHDNNIAENKTDDEAIRFYISSETLSAKGLTGLKIIHTDWNSPNNYGYEANVSEAIDSTNSNASWYMKVWGDVYSDATLTFNIENPNAVSFPITTNSNSNNVLIPEALQSKTVSSAKVVFGSALSEMPDDSAANVWFNHVNESYVWSPTGTCNEITWAENYKLFKFNSFATTPTYFGMETNQNTNIEKVIITFSDGSAYTINNSNYVAETSSPIEEIINHAFVQEGDPNNVTIPETLREKELQCVTITFGDSIGTDDSWTIANAWICNSNWNAFDNDGRTINNNIAVFQYAGGITTSYYLGLKSVQYTNIEKVVVAYKDNSTLTINNTNYVAPVPETYTKVTVQVPDSQPYAVLTLTSDNSWKDSLQNLPLTDENGNTYRYFIKENDVNGYMPVGYYLNNGSENTVNYTELTGNSTQSFKIWNAPSQSEETQLPEAGGTGTAPYKATGFLMMLTAVTIPYIKRKEREQHKSA